MALGGLSTVKEIQNVLTISGLEVLISVKGAFISGHTHGKPFTLPRNCCALATIVTHYFNNKV